MNANRLDRRIQARRVVRTPDGLGGHDEAWIDYGAAFAGPRHDISDTEKFTAGAILATVTARFVVRHTAHTASLTPRDRITCDDAEWEIDGIKEVPRPRRRFLEITATRRA
ncbi:hypothetical protein BV509_09105 [Rhodovulum sulfidophilum]|nr:hypothetical protein BV509_09105 [Rhodovulum sulfidophilum]